MRQYIKSVLASARRARYHIDGVLMVGNTAGFSQGLHSTDGSVWFPARKSEVSMTMLLHGKHGRLLEIYMPL